MKAPAWLILSTDFESTVYGGYFTVIEGTCRPQGLNEVEFAKKDDENKQAFDGGFITWELSGQGQFA